MHKFFLRPIVIVVIAAATFLIYQTAQAGPPSICWPLEIGDAKSLPWGNDPFDTISGYMDDQVIKDTLAILESDVPVIVRMETIRRASIYLNDDQGAAYELLANLIGRALDSEMKGKPNAGAYFNAGYLAQAYYQLHSREYKNLSCGSSNGVIGYAWILRAIELNGDNDPMLQFAAALATNLNSGPMFIKHFEKAKKAVPANKLLAVNFKNHSKAMLSHHDYWNEKNK